MKPETLERSLRKHAFVSELNEAQTRFLLGCTKNARFSKGDYLAREGKPADKLFLIRSGRVALQSHVPERGNVVLETIETGDVVGFSVLFPPHRWSVDVKAVEKTLAFLVDGACLRDKVQADHTFGLAIVRRMLIETHGRLVRARLQQLDVYRAEAT